MHNTKIWVSRLLLAICASVAIASCGDEEGDSNETRCGGGAPQCCCDFKREVNRYAKTCRASCEEDPDDKGTMCVSDTACGF